MHMAKQIIGEIQQMMKRWEQQISKRHNAEQTTAPITDATEPSRMLPGRGRPFRRKLEIPPPRISAVSQPRPCRCVRLGAPGANVHHWRSKATSISLEFRRSAIP